MLFTFHILEIALDANTSIFDSTLKILEVTRKFKVTYDRSEPLLLIRIIGFRDFGFLIFFFLLTDVLFHFKGLENVNCLKYQV